VAKTVKTIIQNTLQALLDATLHTVYRMNQIKTLTNNQLQSVSDFLVAITRELPPMMMVKLMRKVVVDIPDLNQSSITPLLVGGLDIIGGKGATTHITEMLPQLRKILYSHETSNFSRCLICSHEIPCS
jgi:hypothetical protein